MTKIIYECYCDKCGEKSDVSKIAARTGYDIDPSGGPSQPAGTKFELCRKCLCKIVQDHVDSMAMGSFDAVEKWLISLRLKHKETY